MQHNYNDTPVDTSIAMDKNGGGEATTCESGVFLEARERKRGRKRRVGGWIIVEPTTGREPLGKERRCCFLFLEPFASAFLTWEKIGCVYFFDID